MLVMTDSDSSSVFSQTSDVWSDRESDEEEGIIRERVLFDFEPAGEGVSSSDSDEDAGEAEAEDRRGNTNWCTCGNCQAMESRVMCRCCGESPEIVTKKELTGVQCITLYPGFDGALLSPLTLDIAYLHFRQEARERGWRVDGLELRNRRYRYIAYRQFVRWIFGVLGRQIRVPLPACLIQTVRNTFPLQEKDEEFEGFHWPEEH